MRKLTKLAIGTVAAHLTTVALAAPALADDGEGGAGGAGGALAATPALGEALHTAGVALAAVAGVVLLSKVAAAYRRSQWRRQWILRNSTESFFVSSVGWPAGGISGRSIARPTAGFATR